MKKECKIIQDLLPNYIEKLTSEETNKYIKEHLKECEECKKVLETMQKEIKDNTPQNKKREIKYLKKYNRRLKLLVAIIIVALVIYIIVVARRMIIISSLTHKANEYINNNNCKITSYSYSGGFSISKATAYIKGDRFLMDVEVMNNDSTSRLIMAGQNGKGNVYYVGEEKTIVMLDEETFMPSLPVYLYPENLFELIFISIISPIRTAECNGKECYLIDTWRTPQYVDKNTGIAIRRYEGVSKSSDGIFNTIVDYQCEFGNVTEKDLIGPNISECEIYEENN